MRRQDAVDDADTEYAAIKPALKPKPMIKPKPGTYNKPSPIKPKPTPRQTLGKEATNPTQQASRVNFV